MLFLLSGGGRQSKAVERERTGAFFLGAYAPRLAIRQAQVAACNSSNCNALVRLRRTLTERTKEGCVCRRKCYGLQNETLTPATVPGLPALRAGGTVRSTV